MTMKALFRFTLKSSKIICKKMGEFEMNETRAFIHYKAEMKEEIISRLNELGGEILEVSEILNLIIYKLRRVEVMKLETIIGVITVTDKRGNGLE